MLHTYVGCNTKKKFKWILDSAYGSVWINMDIILYVWKPHKGSKSEATTIPQKHITFAKDNLIHIAAAENDVENGYEMEDGDGET